MHNSSTPTKKWSICFIYFLLQYVFLFSLQSGGAAFAADKFTASPQREQLIQKVATKMVKYMTSDKKTLECECQLFKGVLPYAECNDL